MTEVAAVVLGALVLAGPTYKLYKECSLLLSTIRNQSKELNRYQQRFAVAQTLFANELKLIFSLVVGVYEADRMLEDNTHERWRDPELEVLWQNTLGCDFDQAISIVSATLQETKDKITGLRTRVNDCFVSCNLHTSLRSTVLTFGRAPSPENLLELLFKFCGDFVQRSPG